VTLIDHFAGIALQEIYRRADVGTKHEEVAKQAYRVASAMMESRQKCLDKNLGLFGISVHDGNGNKTIAYSIDKLANKMN
jgi:hypothetical protein